MALTPEQKMKALAEKIKAQVLKSAGKGLNALRVFLTARIKEEMSVPAPRKKLPGGGYRATTAAIPHAPIRKLSGRARSSLTSILISPTEVWIGTNVVGAKGFKYPKYHETRNPSQPGSGMHQFIKPVLKRYKAEMGIILGGEVEL